MLRLVLLVLISSLVTAQAIARMLRNPAQRAAFLRHHPCPASGRTRGACPGYVVDHIEPLCADGPDNPGNMQWQTVQAVSYTHLRAHETRHELVCRLLLEKKKK